MRWSWSWLVVISAGCSQHHEVQVEMQPVAEGLERTLTGDTSLSQVLSSWVAERYGAGPVASRASAVFARDLPGDFGGAGFYQRFESDLGSASFYCERLLPWTEPWAAVERIQAASDAAAKRLMSWFRFELADEPRFSARTESIERDLRRLLGNLGLAALLYGKASDQDMTSAALVLQLAVEAGLLAPEDLPRFYQEDDRNLDWLLARGRSLAAQYLELPADSPALAFLSTAGAIEHSWKAWCDSTSAEQETEKDMKDFVDLVFRFHLFGDTRRATLSLTTGTEPYETNGNWDDAARKVSWRAESIEDGEQDPRFHYAWWSVPDETAQRLHFDAVLLEGGRLADYVLWQVGLAEDEAQQWRAFLESVRPGADLEARLQAFRFETPSHEPSAARRPAPDKNPPEGARLLAWALKH